MQQQQPDNPPPYSIADPSAPAITIKPPKVFGTTPMQLTCATCRRVVTTTVVHDSGACTYIAAVTVCVIFFPCFWVPLVINSCKDVHHMCPTCNAVLGTYKII